MEAALSRADRYRHHRLAVRKESPEFVDRSLPDQPYLGNLATPPVAALPRLARPRKIQHSASRRLPRDVKLDRPVRNRLGDEGMNLDRAIGHQPDLLPRA